MEIKELINMLLDWASKLSDWRWPILVLILVAILVPLFKKELGELIGKIKKLGISSKGVELEFDNAIKRAKEQVKGIEREVAASHTMRSAERTVESGNQTARDIVLEAWGSLKQVIFDACLSSGLALTPTTGVDEAVRRLGQARTLDLEFSSLVKLLNEWGERLARDVKIRPPESAAWAYRHIACALADWVMLNIVSRPVSKGITPVPPPSPARRATSVSDFFPKPQPGSPAALLEGISGVVRAKRFPVDKEVFRIGRDADNDLEIRSDDFVSGHHAVLRYQAGSLLLSDEGSRNGTFVNEQRVPSVALRQGDQVRIGNAIFRVLAATSGQMKTPGNENLEPVG